jgi:hypothetical protein
MRPARNPHEMQAEILKAARRGQEVFGQVIRTSADKVRSAAPLHELKLPFADRIPFADKLPTPEEVAGNVRGFAARLRNPEELAGNARDLARKLPNREELAGSVRQAAARLPKPEELAASATELASRLLASQRRFADQVLRVTTPQLPGGSQARTGTASGEPGENGQGTDGHGTTPGNSHSEDDPSA